uniref:Uncharacterized protein n=1 Tax=Avena sativa TaxID=4498 RepID=A0ACD5U6V3_AVESA
MFNILQDTSDGNEATVRQQKLMLSVTSNIRVGATDDDQSQEVTIKQGETIRTDLDIQGSKIYSDAAWKTKKVPDSQERILTGLGVYCQIQHDHTKATVLIQASTAKAPSPLHVEAMALLLASQIAEQLKTPQVTFLTDNLTLSRAAAATKTTDTQVPWELREHIAVYKNASKELQSRIFHIKRDINGVAHNYAHQAIRQNQSRPIFSCSNSAHTHDNCPIVLAVQNLNSHGIVLHAVQCI